MSFVSHMPRPGIAPRTTSFVFDTNTLDRLRHDVTKGAEGLEQSHREVAQQFESLFIQMLLKQARAASIPGAPEQSDALKMANSMHDEQLALSLAQGQGMGLTEALMAMMKKHNVGPVDEAGQALSNPESNPSRVAGLTSQMPLERSVVAETIDGLIDLITKGVDVIKEAPRQILATGAQTRTREFMDKIGDAAHRVAMDSGIPVELILSQAALESGWGRREIKDENGNTSHNLFGIKATPNWKGKVVHITTTEYVDGVAKKMKQPFRAYDSYEDSLADFARLISTSDRYAPVMKAKTPEDAAVQVQKAGYATDPNYAQKLISIMSYFKAA